MKSQWRRYRDDYLRGVELPSKRQGTPNMSVKIESECARVSIVATNGSTVSNVRIGGHRLDPVPAGHDGTDKPTRDPSWFSRHEKALVYLACGVFSAVVWVAARYLTRFVVGGR